MQLKKKAAESQLVGHFPIVQLLRQFEANHSVDFFMIPLQVTKCYKPSVIDAVGSPPGRFTPASQADCGGFLVNEKRSNPFGSWGQ